MDRMLLVLSRSPEQEAALQALLAAQQNPSSPQFRKWLTPEEFGERFGAADQDIATITAWLESQGFHVDRVSTGKSVIEFSGTAGQVQNAFHTGIHKYVVNGESHWANASDPQIPAALASVISGVATLHNFKKKTQLIRSEQKFEAMYQVGAQPQFTSGTTHALSPGDYAIIYDLTPLFQAGINGFGRTIAVVGRTNIDVADVNQFRTVFGLASNPPQIVLNGADPGDLGGGEEAEAVLDTSWAGATAPQATVKLVVSKSTNASDGVDLSEEYIVNSNFADVMTESFGTCEAYFTQAQANFYSSLAQQGAAQGITVMVASGDSGSAGCNQGSDNTSNGVLSVNLLAANPYTVAVGGTQFNENGIYATYWNGSNGTSLSSARSYIPENVWNESCTIASGKNPCTGGNSPGLWAGGGGASAFYPKPSWQSGVPGIPNDGKRDVPDVSLTAAGHDPYLLCLDGSCTPNSRGLISFQGYAGTSAATPSFAGIIATILQKVNGRLGPLNAALYQLAASENFSPCNGSSLSGLPASTCIFHDVTLGNNAVPGVSGYNTTSGSYQAHTGYDLATGLGSVDAANLGEALIGNSGGTPVLGTSNTTVSFGNVLLGTSQTREIVLSNTGTGNLSLTQFGIAGAGTQFSYKLACGSVIIPGTNCSLILTFKPTVTGPMQGFLTFVVNTADPFQEITISGTGVSSPTAYLSATALNFGNQKVVTRSAPQTITLTNSTLNALDTSDIPITGADEDFVLGNTCGPTLASAASCILYVTFTPMLIGARSASIAVPVDASGTAATVSLSGAGTANGFFQIASSLSGKVLDVSNSSTSNGALIEQSALNGNQQQEWMLVPLPSGYYAIQNAMTHKVLDVMGGFAYGGALIQQWDYLGGANQQWQLIAVDDVHYKIVNRGSGKALDVVNGSRSDGALIQQWDYLGDAQQLWVLLPVNSYNIKNTFSANVLDVQNGSTADGALIQQWSSNGYRQQQWQFMPAGGGYYAILNRLTGKALDVWGGSVAGGAAIQQWDYLGGANQQWQLVSLDGTNYEIVNRQSGKVLDDTNHSTASGTVIHQWDYLGGTNQQWQLTPVTYYTIVNRLSGLALDVVNGSTANGARIQQWPSNGNQQQQWQLVPTDGGYFAIMGNLSSKVLDDPSSSQTEGTLMQQWSYLAGDNQQWQLIPLSGGYYEIMNNLSGKVLDVTAGSPNAGALIQQWDYLGGANQQWLFVPVTN